MDAEYLSSAPQPEYHRAMSYLPRVAARSAGWADLVDELDRWEKAGRVAQLWWRDDDAVSASAQLERLLKLAERVPLALAVIPALARPDLAALLHGLPTVAVLQHGWRHANRARAGKKSEYPPGRRASLVATELMAGRARLSALFGARSLPVFVPPWNRFAPELAPLLEESGFSGWSAVPARGKEEQPAAVARVDVHVDLVAWHSGREFIGKATALAAIVGQLQARRLATAAGTEPIGILTHHLVMDSAAETFLTRLVALTGAHAAARWVMLSELLQ